MKALFVLRRLLLWLLLLTLPLQGAAANFLMSCKAARQGAQTLTDVQAGMPAPAHYGQHRHGQERGAPAPCGVPTLQTQDGPEAPAPDASWHPANASGEGEVPASEPACAAFCVSLAGLHDLRLEPPPRAIPGAPIPYDPPHNAFVYLAPPEDPPRN